MLPGNEVIHWGFLIQRQITTIAKHQRHFLMGTYQRSLKRVKFYLFHEPRQD